MLQNDKSQFFQLNSYVSTSRINLSFPILLNKPFGKLNTLILVNKNKQHKIKTKPKSLLNCQIGKQFSVYFPTPFLQLLPNVPPSLTEKFSISCVTWIGSISVSPLVEVWGKIVWSTKNISIGLERLVMGILSTAAGNWKKSLIFMSLPWSRETKNNSKSKIASSLQLYILNPYFEPINLRYRRSSSRLQLSFPGRKYCLKQHGSWRIFDEIESIPWKYKSLLYCFLFYLMEAYLHHLRRLFPSFNSFNFEYSSPSKPFLL